jgi:tetratricopeptide (TPR) repeat protein
MFKLSTFFTALIPAVAIAIASTPAVADPGADGSDAARSARAAELNEAGARLYRERHYRQAIEKFIEAHAIDKDANLLFNIARCYEELGDNAAAIEKYTAYVNAPGTDAAGRLRAEQSLRALRALQRRAAQEPKPAPVAGGGAKPPADGPAAAPDAGSASRRRTLAWSALGASAVVAGLGATAFYLGTRDHDRVTSSPGYGDPTAVDPLTQAEARALADSGDWKKLAGGIGMGVGAALLATSVALFIWTGEAPARAGTVAFAGAPAAGGFQTALTVRF